MADTKKAPETEKKNEKKEKEDSKNGKKIEDDKDADLVNLTSKLDVHLV